MREILFKAKRIPDGKWTDEGTYVYVNGKDYIVPWYASAMYGFEVDPDTVCQYTGLKDKNGNKIFEGDIIIHDTKSLIDEKRFDRGTIVFDEKTAHFVRTSDEDEQKLFEIWKRLKDDYEVVGNIHDKGNET